MKYYILKIVTNTAGQDGTEIVAVYNNLESARVKYHQLLATMHNAQDVLWSVVSILNENGDSIIKEIVDHRPEPTPEPETEAEE